MLLVRAALLALFLESVLYGIFFVLYWALLVALVHQGDDARLRKRILLPTSSVMLVLASAHVIMSFVRCYTAFSSVKEPLSYFENIAHPLFTAKNVVYVTQTLIGDSVLIWRCYMVYGKRLYVAIFPGLAQIANACAGYAFCWAQANGATVFSTMPWSTTFAALTVSINVSCSMAIFWRIYRTGRFVGGSTSLMPVLTAIVESGTLYSIAVLGLLIAYLRKSNGGYTAVDVIPPLVGITYALIALQIQFRLDPTNIVPFVGPRLFRTPRFGSGNHVDLPMKTFSVRVCRETEVHSPAPFDELDKTEGCSTHV